MRLSITPAVSASDKQALRENKADIIAALQQEDAGVPSIGDLVEYLDKGRWRRAIVLRIWFNSPEAQVVPERVGWYELDIGKKYNVSTPVSNLRRFGT